MDGGRRLSAATLLALVVVSGCSGGGDPSTPAQTPPPSPTSAVSVRATPSEPSPDRAFTDLDEVAEHLDQGGDWLSSGAGGVWITNGPGIERLDPTTGEVVAQIAVPQEACESTTVGMGFVWTATCGEPGVARIDPG